MYAIILKLIIWLPDVEPDKQDIKLQYQDIGRYSTSTNINQTF